MEPLIQVERRSTHFVVRMNRPEKKNAMNRAARRGLLEAFELARERTKVVVLTGCDGSFCSGVDLKEYRDEVEGRLAPEPESEWINVNLAIRRHRAVFIAAVNGIALGGGATLIGVCDLAIAADDAEIGLPEIGFGAYPQFSGPAVQKRIAGKRAAWMVLTGRRISATTAESWGLINRSVPHDLLLREAELLAEEIAGFEAATLAESKWALDAVPAHIPGWKEAFEYGLGVNARIARAGFRPGEPAGGTRTFIPRTPQSPAADRKKSKE
jgi:enoyl-CoA hydratase/carnithine racemase